jgi:hypothetical protein
MLADPRSRSLVTSFAAQWLHLRNLESITPDGRQFPDFDDNLPQAFLAIAVAEHKVQLEGRGGDSQCDVLAIVRSGSELISLAVEAKALEKFGDQNLKDWLEAGKSERAKLNRTDRWEHLRASLPVSESYLSVQYQLLHRCGAAIIEAKRLRLTRAACVIQSFRACPENTAAYGTFCRAIDPKWKGPGSVVSSVDGISLNIGWVDCRLATDREVAACV